MIKIAVYFQGMEEQGFVHNSEIDLYRFLAQSFNDFSVKSCEYSLMGECWFLEIVGDLINRNDAISFRD
ncbi:hypothetical protein EP331_00420 [bacterium]|nr:MAG: hypothetical protein EP331_00420 [bacterium]